MEEFINLIVNNGIGVVCVGFILYFVNTTMKKLTENQEKTNIILQSLTDRLESIEKRLERNEKNE